MGNKQGGTAEEEESPARLENGEEGEEEAVELPPPMKPIQEPILVPSDDTQGERVSILRTWDRPPRSLKSENSNSCSVRQTIVKDDGSERSWEAIDHL